MPKVLILGSIAVIYLLQEYEMRCNNPLCRSRVALAQTVAHGTRPAELLGAQAQSCNHSVRQAIPTCLARNMHSHSSELPASSASHHRLIIIAVLRWTSGKLATLSGNVRCGTCSRRITAAACLR